METSIPNGWIETKFDDVAEATDYVANGSFESLRVNVETTKEKNFAILVRLKDFNSGWKKDDLVFVTKRSYDFLKKSSLLPGDLFIANVGAPGKTFIVPDLSQPMTIGPNGLRIRANKSTFNKFLYFFYNSPFGKSELEKLIAGSAQQKFNKTGLRSSVFLLPPLAEQALILGKLDALFDKIEDNRQRLNKIPLLLKRFRQSVLAAAVSGRLTEDWRKDKTYCLDTDLPIEWRVVKIDNLINSTKTDLRTGPFGTALKKHEHQLQGVPVWGIESIGENGSFTDYNKIFVTKEKAEQLKSFEVKAGNIIISRSGTVGELCILPDKVQYGLISTNLMKIVLNNDVILSKYFCWLFDGSQLVMAKLRELCSGSTRLFLTQAILKEIDYPLPPLEEQREIINRVDQLFTFSDKIEARYAKAKSMLDKMPQAILAKAFRGELVPQDPNDEPASMLLERIKGRSKQNKLSKTTESN